MRVQYRLSDGDNLSMWLASSTPYTAPSGFAYTDSVVGIPSEALSRPEFYTCDGTDIFRKDQSVIDAMLAIENFDAVVFGQSLLARFQGNEFSTPTIRFEWGAFKEFVSQNSAGGFATLKTYLLGMIPSIYQTQDYDAVNNSCIEQGVDLDNF